MEAILKDASSEEIPSLLELVQQVRKDRATNIQGYSREKALGPEVGAATIK